MPEWLTPWVFTFAKIGFVVALLFGIGPVLIMGDRKVSAWIQGRIGPNRVGPLGAFQPVADIVKFMLKEVIVPTGVEKGLFYVAPLLVFIPPVLGYAVIPWGNQIGDERLQIADLNIGVLFVMSVLSVGVYGITLGGWSSNNKYALLGTLRAAAQLISYELTLGLTILMVVMMAESVDLNTIVLKQAEHGWNIFGGGNLLLLPCGVIGSVLFYTCALAENNRLPFDMSECEAELVGGYHTEYSAAAFATFMFAEYMGMILSASLLTTLFLGGWHFPGLIDPNDHSVLGGVLSVGVFVSKISVILFSYIWIRWTLPRFRYDQVMQLGWKGFLPISLVNIGIVACVGVLLEGSAS